MKQAAKIAALLLFAAVVMIGTPPITFNINSYWTQVVNDAEGNPGGGLEIGWDEPYTGGGSNIFGCSSSNAEEKDIRYIITVDGVDVDTVVETTYTLYTPAKLIEIWALVDFEYMSQDPVEIDLEPVTTPSLVAWSIEDTAGYHPSGFGFDIGLGDGSVSAYTIGTGFDEEIDYFLDTGLVLTASYMYQPDHLNIRCGRICEQDEDYDSLTVVKPYSEFDNDYAFEMTCETGDVFGLRIDRSANAYFAKIEVLNTDGYEVAFKIDVQLEPGLRWVVTN
jgi:hypothetical protein